RRRRIGGPPVVRRYGAGGKHVCVTYDPSMAQPSFTLGIEEEFQVVDPETRGLKSHIQELFAEGEKRLKDEIKREMHDPVIEVGTPICANVAEARTEVTRLRGEIIRLVRENGMRIASAGTHPITHWKDVEITPAARYDQ